MPGAIKILPYYTYEDYVQWEGKWELIDGIPHAMSPAPTPRHQMIANSLGALFYLALKNCQVCKAYQAIDYKLSEDTILQPDISVLCQQTTKKYIDFPPALVAEILSASTAVKDRHSKFSLYEQEKIPYYLIVSPDTEVVEVYMLNGNDHYELKEQGHDVSFDFYFEYNCSSTIEFIEIWK